MTKITLCTATLLLGACQLAATSPDAGSVPGSDGMPVTRAAA
jgi:hypothetical protein